MKVLKVVLSNDAPNMKDALWLKPEKDGYALYVPDGSWKKLKLSADNAESKVAYEEAGAAEAAKKKLIGSSKDKSTTMSLYGLKAYVDEQIVSLE